MVFVVARAYRFPALHDEFLMTPAEVGAQVILSMKWLGLAATLGVIAVIRDLLLLGSMHICIVAFKICHAFEGNGFATGHEAAVSGFQSRTICYGSPSWSDEIKHTLLLSSFPLFFIRGLSKCHTTLERRRLRRWD